MSETQEKKGGKFFTLAPIAIHQLCTKLIELYHSDLDSAAAKVDIVMAFRDPEGEAPAMEKDGHRILGQSSVIKLKDRVKGMGDCEVMLDGDAWDSLPEKQQAALLDHELEHFEVKRDKEGDFIFDDLNRPTIKIRNHDRQFGWFDTVAQRHRSDSMEVHQLQKLFAEAGQIYLPFVDKEGEIAERASVPIDKLKAMDETTVSVSVCGGEPIPMTGKVLLKKIAQKMQEDRE